MPTSVLLAVLVAAGLLALAPALVRRYDATERLVAERASSTARVLSRRRRRRTVPGRAPVNPPSSATDATPDEPAHPPRRPPRRTGRPRREPEHREPPGRPGPSPTPRPRVPRPRVPRPRDPVELRRWWRHRRRRVFGTILGLVAVEAAGVALVGPGFLVGLTLSAGLLLWYVAALRHQVVVEHRRRLRQRLDAAERHARRAAERRRLAEKQRRMAEARRHARELAGQRGEEAAQQRADDAGTPGVPGLRGQSYQTPAANF